jgi:hypothetical protein
MGHKTVKRQRSVRRRTRRKYGGNKFTNFVYTTFKLPTSHVDKDKLERQLNSNQAGRELSKPIRLPETTVIDDSPALAVDSPVLDDDSPVLDDDSPASKVVSLVKDEDDEISSIPPPPDIGKIPFETKAQYITELGHHRFDTNQLSVLDEDKLKIIQQSIINGDANDDKFEDSIHTLIKDMSDSVNFALLKNATPNRINEFIGALIANGFDGSKLHALENNMPMLRRLLTDISTKIKERDSTHLDEDLMRSITSLIYAAHNIYKLKDLYERPVTTKKPFGIKPKPIDGGKKSRRTRRRPRHKRR